MSILRVFLSVCLLGILLCSTVTAHNDADQVLAKFKAAREARLKLQTGSVALAVPDSNSGDMDFETRRAALLAQAEMNIPQERDLEWEKQLLEDRRSIYFDRDRSIMDDPNEGITNDPLYSQHVAGIRPADL